MEIALTVLIIVSLMLSLRFFMYKKSQRVKGKVINTAIFDNEIQNILKNKKSILYFYTPTCGACKTQAPIIDEMQKELKDVGKIDLTQNRKAVKEFGILGTPTTVIMSGNRIAEIFVGFRKYDFLKTKFEEV